MLVWGRWGRWQWGSRCRCVLRALIRGERDAVFCVSKHVPRSACVGSATTSPAACGTPAGKCFSQKAQVVFLFLCPWALPSSSHARA